MDVPEIMPGEHFGDYIEMEIAKDGHILNWDKDLEKSDMWNEFILAADGKLLVEA